MPFSFLLSCRLPLQQIHFVRQHRFAVAEKSDDDSEADGSLRGSIGNDEKREDLSSYVTVQTGKGDQVEQVFALFIIADAAAEAAVGLGIIIAFFRNRETV